MRSFKGDRKRVLAKGSSIERMPDIIFRDLFTFRNRNILNNEAFYT